MPVEQPRNPADFIVPLAIGRLEGRMLHIPAAAPVSEAPESTRPAPEILFVYGHHSSLERWWGLMEVLSKYGSVTMPDLPGFGGMDSFYTLGQKPTIDAMADYLAAFIKWRYKRKKVTIVGMSFGFVVATRMFQRYPELTKRVTMFISLAGFAHKDDFILKKRTYTFYLNSARLLQHRLPAFIFKATCLNPLVLRAAYRLSHNEKFKDADPARFKQLIDVEVRLWRDNDVRTAMKTSADFLVLDNCRQTVDLPVYHIGVVGDRYFDNTVVEQHLRIIFSDFTLLATLDLVSHAPSVIATAEEAAAFIPESLDKLLREL
ncbi:MAG TPA: alpha/beta hydrolase [Candidatus Saccharimonadales bacterium]|jgi:pimeloyl-ACP methyl ester carboxylesterase